jgi:hypothetical protein
MAPTETLHARDRLRSLLKPDLLNGMRIELGDVGKIYVVSADKATGQLVSREDFLAMDVDGMSEWYEVSEFDLTLPGHGPMHMQNRDAASLLEATLKAEGIPIFFGPHPARPRSVYPVPHMPDQEMLDQAASGICRISFATNFSSDVRQDAARMLLLMLYLHGYATGEKHAELRK